MKTNRPKIEGIFPLRFMQKALLFHSLLEEEDQGIIQIQCRLSGALNQQLFENAWQRVGHQHQALRSSIHWEKVAEPIQVVRPEIHAIWSIEDWRDTDEQIQAQKLTALLAADRKEKLNFNKAPIARYYLIRLADETYHFIWTSHHILLDGWSAAIVLQHVFDTYDAIVKKRQPSFDKLPPYQAYLAWIKKQDLSKIAAFWEQNLSDFQPKLLAGNSNNKGADIKQYAFSFSPEQSKYLQVRARQYKVTFNTLLQGIWGILVAQLLGVKDHAFGNTVSGRSIDLPNIDKMVGLFTNALPLRIQLEADQVFTDWLATLQETGSTIRSAEYVTLEHILSWAKIKDYTKLFDTLLVVQNYPWDSLRGGDVFVEEFQGDLTSTYPLTLIVLPGETTEFVFRYASSQVSRAQIEFLEANLFRLLTLLDNDLDKTLTLSQIHAHLGEPPASILVPQTTTTVDIPTTYNSPSNETELQLTQIWESILGVSPIQTTDDFFELGGTSLLAVRMFSKIDAVFNKKLPPILLLQHRNIQKLAAKLSEEAAADTWSSLVPLKANGTKDPLFCFHAGQGHVFFYNGLAQELDDDRPVYAIQPQGLNGDVIPYDNIKEMAAFYLKEMQKVQTSGRYNILSFCFSNAVCFEIAKQLKAAGAPEPLLIVVDSAPSLSVIKKKHSSMTKSLLQESKKASKKLLKRLFANETENKELDQVRDKLSKMYMRYNWKPYDGAMLFIRSSQFNTQEGKEFHLEVWSKLVLGNIEVEVSEGRHRELFKQPAVVNTSRILRKYLS
ncbi:MAG: condensation domain-containing protein [Bacteroidota bacterium]